MKIVSARVFLLFVIVAGGATSAAAADLGGFYAGANIGGGLGSSKAKTSTVFSPTGYFASSSPGAIGAVGDQSISPSGVSLAGLVGYNWVLGKTLAGVEADFGYFGLSGSETKSGIYPCCAPTGFTVKSEVNTNYLLTARGRFGWVSSSWLYFLTGGLAVTDLTGKFTFTDTFATAAESAKVSKDQAGWTIGGGAEYAMKGPWSLKAEYLYADFGKVSKTSNNLTAFTPPIAFPTNTFSHSVDLRTHILRMGVNYKF